MQRDFTPSLSKLPLPLAFKKHPALWLFCLLFPVLFSFPFLASHPQNPDGMELLMTATQGGNIHGPGYPLQNWLNRLFLTLSPFEVPAYSLSFLNLILFAASLFFLVKTFLLFGLSTVAIVAASYCYAFNPSIWYLSVQPEKYALLCCLFFCLIYLCHLPKLCSPWTFGISLSFGLAHHPFILLCFPFIIHMIWKHRPSQSWYVKSVGLCFMSTFLLYLSLFILRGEKQWPDWGLIQIFSDWIALVLRYDFVGTRLAEHGGSKEVWAATFSWYEYWRIYHFFGALPLLGFIYLLINKRHSLLFSTITSLFLGLVLVLPAKYFTSLSSYAYLERYALALYLPLVIPFGFSIHFLTKQRRPVASLATLVTGLLVFHMIYGSYYRADASRDNILTVFLKGVSALVEKEDIYIAGTDLEAFSGFPVESQKTKPKKRSPLIIGYPWAHERQHPLADPRVIEARKEGARGIYHWSQRKKLRTVSTYQWQLKKMGFSSSELYGLIYRSAPPGTPFISIKSAHAAYKLCPTVQELNEPLPQEGHFYSQFLMEWFGRAFLGATKYFTSRGDNEMELLSYQLSRSLYINAENTRSLNSLCKDFTRIFKERYLPQISRQK